MWETIGKYALQFGIWCFKNRTQIEAGLTAAKNAFDAIHAAKAGGK